ncbi:MAG: NAD-dependent epimerase/dehydratase family protein [Pirellulales bacterium]
MTKVLVTGATGFIGSKLTQRLVADGDEVTCLVRNPARAEALARLGARLVPGDVRDTDSVRTAVGDSQIVYHLAGVVTTFRSQEMTATNVTAFRNIASACADRSSPPTLLYVSSLAAAGPSIAGRPRVESDPAAPVSNYGRSKRAAELIAEEFAAQVPITIVRPPIVYGEGDQNMLSVYRSIFRRGIHLAFGVAKSKYSLVHVSDLVDALVLCAQRGSRLTPSDGFANSSASRLLADRGAPSGYYFVAGDEQPTFAELGTLIGAALGRARVFICRSPSTVLLWSTAAAAEVVARLRGRPYILNFDKVREARAGSWTCSAQSIHAQCGFAPQAPLVDRLRQTANWYLQQKML